jgi:hypothetical protein
MGQGIMATRIKNWDTGFSGGYQTLNPGIPVGYTEKKIKFQTLVGNLNGLPILCEVSTTGLQA